MDYINNSLSILVCDDDPGDIKILKSHLKQVLTQEFSVLQATTAEEIESIIKENRNKINLIFMDYQMPGKSGIEWLKEIREINFAPVIMLTGRGDEKLAVEAMKNGAADYIPKDHLDQYELTRAVANALEKWEVENERDALLGIAAHELRNPLTTIQGYTQMLQMYDAINPENGKEMLSIIGERTRHMLDVINRLLNINSIDKGTLIINKGKNDIVSFLKNEINNFEMTAKSKNIKINFKTTIINLSVCFDKERFNEVTSNLLDNAIKYSKSNTNITVYLKKEDNFVLIEISDEGPGIKEEEMKFLFNLFSNVKISTQPTAGEQSTGLGLAICKKIVSLHDGKINVASEQGKGTTFSVFLPIGDDCFIENEIVDKSKFTLSKKLPANVPDNDKHKLAQQEEDYLIKDETIIGIDEKVILVIEDNKDLLDYMERCLDQYYRIIKAENMEIGLQKAFSIIPDLVISDIMMPGKSGYEGCEMLKSDEKTSHIPVILLTARAEMADKIKGLDIGADDYITKPFNTEELLARAKNLIESRERLRKGLKEKVIIKPSEITTNSVDENFLNKIMGLIEKNMQNYLFTVDDLSREMYLSQSQLYRKLLALTSQSPSQFILSVR
ncbi:MAG: response regulator, partial [Ignavibacteriaceae bacterium]